MNDAAGVRVRRWTVGITLCTALLLGWLTVRSMAQGLLNFTDPKTATLFWPADGEALANEALRRVIAAGGSVDTFSTALATRALDSAPRSALPLVIAGFRASEGGDLPRARALMEAARARQPRTDTARYWLLDHYIRTGNYAAALNEIGPAISLRPGSGTPLMDLVGGLATIPVARTALVAKLKREPSWRGAFFQQEANAPLPPRTILGILESVPPNSNRDAARAEQHAVIGALIGRNDFATAYGVWLSFLPPGNQPSRGEVYDPNFAGLPGADPFNWSFQSGPDLTVGRVSMPDVSEASGLAINFRGTVPSPIASEIVPAVPGTYRFSLKARRIGDATTGSRIVATVRCSIGNAVLATMPIEPLTSALRIFQVGVTVPASCNMVTIQFSGEPGDGFSVVAAQVTSVALVRT